MSTMTEGAVDVLEALGFDPVCDHRRPVPCDAAATWALRFDPSPCEHHAHPWLTCDEHMQALVQLLAVGAACALCLHPMPYAGDWRSLR